MTETGESPLPLSTIEGIVWPPIPDPRASALLALIRELEHSQWLPPDEIARRQMRQLVVLAEYCERQSPPFARRLRGAGLQARDLGDAAALTRCPVLTRRDIQTLGAELFCRELPQGHTPQLEMRTSGSTGEPVSVRRTALTAHFWSAMAIREHLWHRRDFKKPLCAIRANAKDRERAETWGPPVGLVFETGPSQILPIDRDAPVLFGWIAEFAPGNLLIYPSTLDALTQHCRRNGGRLPSLSHIRTVGEMLLPRIRDEARAWFGVPVEDIYSSNEIGYIAAQCPESGLYHIMAEDVIVEVLDENGHACRDGEAGRVVVTSLHNFAMPLIRYDIGDYAEVAGPCPCGRGLPALRRIVGRERNLILMPDGSRFWPVGGMIDARDVAPVLQWQLVQTERERLELRLVTERALTASEEETLRSLIAEKLRHPFAVCIAYFERRLPLGPNGKFEEFMCLVQP
jgi:phenylacetate-coenzyme A ligase PaaK-like adenylate-forming protein